MTKTTVCVSFLLFSSPVMACTTLPATLAFIVINDQNGDRALNEQEWLNAHISDNLELAFELNQQADFSTFDRNGNGKIEAREIGFENVRYRQDPCASAMRVRGRFNSSNSYKMGLMP